MMTGRQEVGTEPAGRGIHPPVQAKEHDQIEISNTRHEGESGNLGMNENRTSCLTPDTRQSLRLDLKMPEPRDIYREFFDLAPVGCLILDRYNLIREANQAAAEMLGLSREKLSGLRFCRFIALDSQDQFFTHYQRLLELAPKQKCELRMEKDDGGCFYAEVESLLVNSGESRQHFLTLTDITGRKQLAEQRESQRLGGLRELCGNTYHDLENPLAVIDSSVYYLKSRLRDSDARVAAHLDRIQQSVDCCVAISRSLLNLAQSQQSEAEQMPGAEKAAATD